MTIRRIRRSVLVWACKCRRCGYSWDSTEKKKPARCAGCKAEHFDKPARPYRRRRKRA